MPAKNLVLTCLKDQNVTIRRQIGLHLRVIAENCDRDIFRAQLLPSLVYLLQDPDTTVTHYALDATASVLDRPGFLGEEEFDNEVIPCIERLESYQDLESDLAISKVLGQVTNFRRQRDPLLIRLFCHLVESSSTDVRWHLSFSMPCFYRYYNRDYDFGDLYASFSQMEDDVRVTLSKGIHEVVREAHVKARDPFVFVDALLI